MDNQEVSTLVDTLHFVLGQHSYKVHRHVLKGEIVWTDKTGLANDTSSYISMAKSILDQHSQNAEEALDHMHLISGMNTLVQNQSVIGQTLEIHKTIVERKVREKSLLESGIRFAIATAMSIPGVNVKIIVEDTSEQKYTFEQIEETAEMMNAFCVTDENVFGFDFSPFHNRVYLACEFSREDITMEQIVLDMRNISDESCQYTRVVEYFVARA